MTEMIDCPAPGCDYSGAEGSVKGHWGGKRDEDHTGSFYGALEGASDTSDTDTSEREPQAPSQDEGSEGGSHPADDVPPREDRSTGSDGTTELPCCGQAVESSELPDEAVTIRCGECGETVRYTP